MTGRPIGPHNPAACIRQTGGTFYDVGPAPFRYGCCAFHCDRFRAAPRAMARRPDRTLLAAFHSDSNRVSDAGFLHCGRASGGRKYQAPLSAIAVQAAKRLNRHPPTQAGFDHGNASCQGRASFDGRLHMKVAQPEPVARTAGFFYRLSKPQYNFSLECFDCACGSLSTIW